MLHRTQPPKSPLPTPLRAGPFLGSGWQKPLWEITLLQGYHGNHGTVCARSQSGAVFVFLFFCSVMKPESIFEERGVSGPLGQPELAGFRGPDRNPDVLNRPHSRCSWHPFWKGTLISAFSGVCVQITTSPCSAGPGTFPRSVPRRSWRLGETCCPSGESPVLLIGLVRVRVYLRSHHQT